MQRAVTLSACFHVIVVLHAVAAICSCYHPKSGESSRQGAMLSYSSLGQLWRAAQHESSERWRESGGSHVTKPALSGPLNKGDQDPMLRPDLTGGGPSKPTHFHLTF